MKSDVLNVLVLCTGNSCRSVMAEALINDLGCGCYQAWSAGSVPVGSVHPKSIETLQRHGIDPGQPRSKSWNECAEQSFDLVITVCDRAAGESSNDCSGVFPSASACLLLAACAGVPNPRRI